MLEVAEQDIARRVSSWTGIPVSRSQEGEQENLALMEQRGSLSQSREPERASLLWQLKNGSQCLANSMHVRRRKSLDFQNSLLV